MKGSNAGIGLAALLILSVRVGFVPAGADAQTPPEPVGAHLTGTIVSASTDQPIPGARIEVHEQVDAEAGRERRLGGVLAPAPLARATADATGRFRVIVPFARRLYVVAEAPGHARSRYARAVYATPGSGEQDLGRLDLPEGRRVTGRVLAPDGKPLAKATVVASAGSGSPGRRGGGAGFARGFMMRGSGAPSSIVAVTASDGRFTLDCLPQRAVTLRVHAAGMATALIENAGQGGALTVRMTAGHPLTGKVVAPDGKSPVAAAWVLAGDEGLDGLTRTDAKGLFRFDHLRAGAAEITASAPGAAAAGTDAATFAPSAPSVLTLPAKDEPRVLRLRTGGIVRARALDAESRQPLAGASFTLDTPGELLPRLGMTGEQGEVLFTGIPLGDVELRAEADRYLDEELGPAAVGAGQTKTMTVAMRLAASLEGTIRDATGRPIAGARVSVSGPPPFALPIPMPIFFPIGVDPVESDKQGRFRLAGLPPKSELKIGVTSTGYVPWEMPGIKLRPGERHDGMEVLLDGGLMITGRVLDPAGQPVAGAEVIATRRQEGGGGFVVRMERRGPGGARGGPGGMGDESLPAVVSGPDGVFRARGARTGIWSLRIASKGHAPETVGGLKLEDSAKSLDAGDIRLEPGALLRGRVATASGEPIPFARGFVRKEMAPLTEFTTGEDGLFVTDDLVPGEAVTLSVDAEGYGSVEKAGLNPPMEDLEITLTPASRVGGKVVDRDTRRPITDFSISMSRNRGLGGGAMRMSMAIGGPETSFHTEDGSFVVEDVDPGRITVSASAPGYRESAMRELEVLPGQDLNDLAFTLARAASISGTVLDDRGRPLPGASVSKKESTGGAGIMMRGAGGSGDASTDGDGNFMLGGLDRGPMTISITHGDFEPSLRDVDTTEDIEGLKIALSRGASLSGFVLREEDGTPVARVPVTATAAGQDRFSAARNATTGPDGAFVIEGISPGRYTVRAESAGLRPAVLEGIVVTAGAAPPPLELRLGGGVSLTGVITGVKEAELPQFTVRAMSTGMGGFGVSAPVDATGHFEMKGLSTGTVTLLAGSGLFGGKSTTKTVQIPEGIETVETQIEFPHGNAVEGVVTRGGEPVDGASVIFMQDATRTSVTAQTDMTGKYRAEDLDDGDYDVSVMQFRSSLSHSLKATIHGDKQLDIEVPTVRITGFVTDLATGEPLEGASISIKQAGAAPATAGGGLFFQQGARTDASGYYQIDGLDDGTWKLTARRDGYGFEERAVSIAPGVAPGEVTFNLAPVDAVSFRAIDSASGPLSSLAALVLKGGGDPLAPAGSGATKVFGESISPDASGIFRLKSLQPGLYRLVLGGQNLGTETLYDFRVPARETTITFGRGGGLEVTAENLKSGETARAVLLDATGRPVHFNTTLTDPVMTLRSGTPTRLFDVKPGAYKLRVSMPGGGMAEKPVTIAAGVSTPVSIP